MQSKNIYEEISRAVLLLYTSASFYHFVSMQFGVMKSLNFIQLQAMAVLAVNFGFGLDFDISGIGVQFSNKLTLCKENIALQTILSLRLCIAHAHD